jgi:ABC-type oligopeptide transport system substrate-binding subunit
VDTENNNLVDYNDIFNFINEHKPDWERLTDGNKVKIKTNEHTVKFEFLEQLKKKYNFRITEVSFSDYYGIVFSIERQ